MKNKKIILATVFLILLFLITAVIFLLKNNQNMNIFLLKNNRKQNNEILKNDQPSLLCAKEGETIGASDTPTACCSGLKLIKGAPDGSDGDCSLSEPLTGLSTCAKCGDGICNNNYEGKCNCPEDCANSKCGKEGETLSGDIDRCCQGLKPKSLNSNGFGGLAECAK